MVLSIIIVYLRMLKGGFYGGGNFNLNDGAVGLKVEVVYGRGVGGGRDGKEWRLARHDSFLCRGEGWNGGAGGLWISWDFSCYLKPLSHGQHALFRQALVRLALKATGR